jgi:hypothetical protein
MAAIHVVNAATLNPFKTTKQNALVKLADDSVVVADVLEEGEIVLLVIQRTMQIETVESLTKHAAANQS